MLLTKLLQLTLLLLEIVINDSSHVEASFAQLNPCIICIFRQCSRLRWLVVIFWSTAYASITVLKLHTTDTQKKSLPWSICFLVFLWMALTGVVQSSHWREGIPSRGTWMCLKGGATQNSWHSTRPSTDLHLCRCNPKHWYRLGGEWLECNSMEKDFGVLVGEELNMGH